MVGGQRKDMMDRPGAHGGSGPKPPTTADIVTGVGEVAIARLDIHDGEVLFLQPSESAYWTPEQGHYFAQALEDWALNRGKHWNVLALPGGISVTVIAA